MKNREQNNKKQRTDKQYREQKARLRYWSRLFPKAMPVLEKLLTNNGQYAWTQLEIAARYNFEDRQVMSRKTTYTKMDDLLLYCQAKNPHSLELGGIYPAGYEDRNNQRRMVHLLNIIGPFVIDIDMDDYHRQGLRKGMCGCEEKQVCRICWNILLEPGRKVLDLLLRNVLGFKKILYVFSGRRGYHCWVADERVWAWTKEQRKAVIQRLQFRPRSGCDLSDQLLRLLEPEWTKHVTSAKQELATMRATLSEEDYLEAKQQHIWDAMFPKFDAHVSIDASHLCKIPLSPHVTTKKITIPLPPIGTAFDPILHTPTLETVDVHNIDAYVQQMKQALCM